MNVEIWGLCWAGPAFQGLWIAGPATCWTLQQKSWPPSLGRGEPIPHHRCGRAGSDGTGLGELVSALPKGGGGPSGPDWRAQLPPRPRSWALGWRTLISTPSVTCLSVWRGWSWGTRVAGFSWLRVTAACLRGIWVRVQGWGCVRGLEPSHDSCDSSQWTFASVAG